ncbi:hypothetical protein JW859_09220 [bacterium]|nr:hypothetical protein [bacterium]
MATERTGSARQRRVAIATHGGWLRGLRLVSRAESWLAVSCAVGALLVMIIAVPAGGAATERLMLALAALSHLLWGLAIALLAPRTRTAALLALTGLSVLNLLVALLAQIPGLAAIARAYGVSGIAALGLGLWGWGRLAQQWWRLGAYRAQDDFRWLITRGPLALRWRVAETVRNLPRHS